MRKTAAGVVRQGSVPWHGTPVIRAGDSGRAIPMADDSGGGRVGVRPPPRVPLHNSILLKGAFRGPKSGRKRAFEQNRVVETAGSGQTHMSRLMLMVIQQQSFVSSNVRFWRPPTSHRRPRLQHATGNAPSRLHDHIAPATPRRRRPVPRERRAPWAAAPPRLCGRGSSPSWS